MSDNNATSMATSDVRTPNLNDVLCGRGGGTNTHPGNVLFRTLVQNKKKLYLMSRFKREKRIIAKEIVTRIRTQNPPGRFLLRNDHTGRYNDIGDANASKKASQALREGAPNIRKEIYDEVLKKRQKSDAVNSGDYDENDDMDEDEDELEENISQSNPVPSAGSSAEGYFGGHFVGYAASAAACFKDTNYCGTYSWQGGDVAPQQQYQTSPLQQYQASPSQQYQSSHPQQYQASPQQYQSFYPPQTNYAGQNPPAHYTTHQVSPYAGGDASQYWPNIQYPAANSTMYQNNNPGDEPAVSTSVCDRAHVEKNEPYQDANNVHNISLGNDSLSRHNTPVVTLNSRPCSTGEHSYPNSNNPVVTPSTGHEGTDRGSSQVRYSSHKRDTTTDESFDSQRKLKRDDSDEKVDNVRSSRSFSSACNLPDFFGQEGGSLCGMKLSFMFSEEENNQSDLELSALHDATADSSPQGAVGARFGGLNRHQSSSSKSSCRPYSPMKGSDRSVWSPMVPMMEGLSW
eukprot:CAMPEP_0194283538 /NCGR_PEP_ID=MMETSP0169-20130528/25614_1 /TAXON_ID=218684 /ORGANISM="Corethron pennatum, Strain L29A3" /LENGTH=513 /DNA_ID=CAMNT_0039029159 /DNA_START=44 /DNA_END=1582 /DNA_ORIENTATION=-